MHRLALPLLAAAATALAGCSPRYAVSPAGPQAYYQTGFPTRDVSGDLQRILRSVKRVQVTGFYQTYRFALADSITAPAVRDRATYRRATERYTFDHTKTGTATVVWSGGGRAMLVTNEHVTALPDTLVVYHRDPVTAAGGGGQSRYVESVSILTERRSLVVGVPSTRPFTVVERDTLADVAVLAVQYTEVQPPGAVEVLNVATGDAEKLSWGSFVYVLGYPRGFQMVTRGIVSEPNRSREHAFLLDGLFNRGISGGLILAVRGDTNALEWVGIATSASAEADYLLLPEARTLEEENLMVPYEGRLYLQRLARIDYGVTFTCPINAIQRVLRQARVIASAPAPDQQ